MITVKPKQLREACGQFSSGVTVITAHHCGQDHGMTANAFMSISLDPPLIAIAIAQTAKMLTKVQESGRFAVSVLAVEMEDIAWHFAGKPKPNLGRLFDRRGGLPVIANAAATFIADVTDEIPAGDHTVFIGRVSELAYDPATKPLQFFRGRFSGLADLYPTPATSENAGCDFIW